MSFNRRNFLLATAGAFSSLNYFRQLIKICEAIRKQNQPPWRDEPWGQSASDDDFWNWVRSNYSLQPTSLTSTTVEWARSQRLYRKLIYVTISSATRPFLLYVANTWSGQGKPFIAKLAALAGVLPEELAINRNSTEGLNSIIFGLNLKEGDSCAHNLWLSQHDECMEAARKAW